jgi:superfamily II DNA helicase RecQ
MASLEKLDEVFADIAVQFNILEVNRYQRDAITNFVNGNNDLFINLPTGCGKSMIYQSLPSVFDALNEAPGHVVAVVSPLVNLMADQVSFLNSVGVHSISLTDIEQEATKLLLEGGKFSVVYGTPEAWLLNDRYRSMLNNSTYSTKLCALAVDEAHVIKQW